LTTQTHIVAVVGAGPAGLFAARQLASRNVDVVLFNRDVKPGGLAEYGIYYDKYKMKEGLRKQFRHILELPNLHYRGNVVVGEQGDLKLEDLHTLGFHAILVSAGAQGTKWLGLPGEELVGVYHAKDLVYHYNKLPPYSEQRFHIGRRVALVGVGNVMMDIAHWLIHDLKVDEVIGIARRGPAEVKFTKKELEYVGANLDRDAFEAEIERVAPTMQAIGQDVSAAKSFVLLGIEKAYPAVADTVLRFIFLASPVRILGDDQGKVCGFELENTTLAGKKDNPKARGLGTTQMLDVDTVVFCIGDKVDEQFGLPVKWNAFVKNPDPCFPVAGLSYEAYDPDEERAIPGVFVAGWSREASSGLVGVARKDGENGAQAVFQYLAQSKGNISDPQEVLSALQAHLAKLPKPVITKTELARLEAIELAEKEQRGLEDFKFTSNEEMFTAIGAQAAASIPNWLFSGKGSATKNQPQ
jgi:ferredoxin/flavodoxin---NADP+ reductase